MVSNDFPTHSSPIMSERAPLLGGRRDIRSNLSDGHANGKKTLDFPENDPESAGNWSTAS